ncbi:MAG: murein biosynthesis integral membrane protein MurJ [Candidatus Tectomicrobia bacterium]|uniref:Probable lipid II flippase MurJ n=1 Tax=Tectimicrobiota bacterium TaxID=2528274 RepID=A0A932CPW9_UNCTE|nr:murein biosynthesis integral membrane protein MurJ [Candidatus Tectomicrobia bacterium]
MIKAAGVVGLATLLSRILGVIRDMIIAYYFGARFAGEAFVVAFRIPNLLRQLVAEGSLTVSFIPVFTDYLVNKPRQDADKLAQVIFTFLLFSLAGIVVLGMILSPWIVTIMTPGFQAYPEKLALTIYLTRLLFPYLFFIGLVAFAMGVLNSFHHFAAPALAPVFLNLWMIAAPILLVPYFERPITALVVGVLLGGVTQLLFQLPFLRRQGIHLKLDTDLSHPGAVQIGRLMIPRVFGVAVAQVTVFFNTFLASYCEPGSNFYLYYADRLMELPLGVFAIALGTVALPTFSRHAAEAQPQEMMKSLSFALRTVLFINLPAMTGLIVLSQPIVNVLFQRGEFDLPTTLATSQALICYAAGLWAFSALRVVVPAFYALQDTRTPVQVAFLALGTHILLSLLLVSPLSFRGLALSSSISSTVNLLILLFILRKRLGRIGGREILFSTLRISGASLGMGGIAYLVSQTTSWTSTGLEMGKLFSLGGAIVLSVATYLVLCHLLRSPEWGLLGEMGKRFFARYLPPRARSPQKARTGK